MFLKRTGALIVLLALGSLGRHFLRDRRATQGRQFEALTPRDAETLSKIADTMLPPMEGFPTNEEIDLIGRLDKKIGALSRGERKDLKALLHAFETFAPVLGPALGTFTSMGAGERHRYLEGWRRSRFLFKRVGFTALKQLVMFTYYTHENTWPAIGFKGTWVGPEGNKALKP